MIIVYLFLCIAAGSAMFTLSLSEIIAFWLKKMKQKKKKKYIELKTRGIPEDHGPGKFNPNRSVKFTDKKKKSNKLWARKHYDDI